MYKQIVKKNRIQYAIFLNKSNKQNNSQFKVKFQGFKQTRLYRKGQYYFQPATGDKIVIKQLQLSFKLIYFYLNPSVPPNTGKHMRTIFNLVIKAY